MASDRILSAARLGITKEERAGLIKLRDLFLSPEAPAHGDGAHHNDSFSHEPSVATLVFSMNYAALPVASKEYSCGCAACIGGHLSLMMQGIDVSCGTVHLTREQAKKADRYVDSHGFGVRTTLYSLFYPREIRDYISWDEISVASAGHAISNFLTTGKPSWLDALTKGGQVEGLANA